LPTDEDLLRTLYIGLPGTAMPAFSQLLSVPLLRALAEQIKLRCHRFVTETAGERIAPFGKAPNYNAPSAQRGAKVYRREGCHSCHGDQGRGDGPAAFSLKDAMNRPILPRNYHGSPFRSGFRRQDILRAFSTGLDGTPMPALPETVSLQDRWDLAHYLVSLHQGSNRWFKSLQQTPSWFEPFHSWRLP
jgi:mono/diheme cytochrome c family protein